MANSNDEVINILVKYGLDKASAQEIVNASLQIENKYTQQVAKIAIARAKEIEAERLRLSEQRAEKELQSVKKWIERRVKEEQSAIKKVEQERARAMRSQEQARRIELESIKQGAVQVQQIARNATILASGALTGIVALGVKYINNTKEQNQLTREWFQATKSVEVSVMRIGAVVAREVLPYLKIGAEYAEKVAEFAEANPEVVKAGIMGLSAVVVIGTAVGTIAKSVQIITTGLQIMDKISKASLLTGAATTGTASVAGAAAGGGLLATAASTIGAAIGLALVTFLAAEGTRRGVNALTGEDKTWSDIATTAKQFTAASLFGWYTIFAKIGVTSEADAPKVWEMVKSLVGLGDQADKTAQDVSSAINTLAGSRFEEEIVNAYTKMREEDVQAAKDYTAAKEKLSADAARKEKELALQHSKSLTQINANYQKRLQDITANYLKTQAAEETRYKNARAHIIRDGGIEIQRIEQDHQETLRKLAEEHREKVYDLVAGRDALGLVREMRAYERKRKEEEQETNREIARRRQDMKIRLDDLAKNFAAERAQRLAEYQANLKEALIQRNEQLKAQREQYTEQLRLLRQNVADNLRELTAQYNAEKERRRNAFIAYVRDLDASLINEQNKKRQYYQLMLKDAEAFLAAYRSKLPTASTKGAQGGFETRDEGGYATRGVYGLAQNGIPEFVMKGSTTRLAERLVGGKLTQGNLIAQLLGGRRAFTVNDHRRFDSRLSREDKRQIEKDQYAMLRDFAKGMA